MRTSAEFTIKQGETYRMRVYFQVYYNIVFQLKYKNIVKKLGFTTKQEQVMGSFSPTKEEHVIDLEEEVAPSGIFARGAVRAAHWVATKGPGRYDMFDVMGVAR